MAAFRLLAGRTFGLGTLGNFLLGFALYGSSDLLPQHLAVSQGFDAQQSGEVMASARRAAAYHHPIRPTAGATYRFKATGRHWPGRRADRTRLVRWETEHTSIW